MSIPSFPTLTGITWPVDKVPTWDTLIQKPISGKESRLQLWTYPKYQWTLSFSILGSGAQVAGANNTDWQTLMGFINSVGGAALPFHYQDQQDNAVTAAALGTGDGTTVTFPFIRSLGGFVEPIQDVTQSGLKIYDNGSQVSGANYTLVTDANWGLTYAVTFNTAPVNTHALTWTGSYNWACRFDDDKQQLSQFMNNYWECKKLSFTSMKID